MKRRGRMIALAMCGAMIFSGCSGQTEKKVENQEKTDSGKETSGELVYEENEKLAAAADAVAYSYVQSVLASENNKVVPGAEMLVLKDGKIVLKKAYGVQQAFDWSSGEGKLLENPVPMETDTLIDLASCTTISATTQAVMKLVTEGRLDVKEKVASYLPEFAQNGKENVTV